MSNMSYCRFRNTLADLRDCREALNECGDYESELSPLEAMAAMLLLKLCRDLADEYLPND